MTKDLRALATAVSGIWLVSNPQGLGKVAESGEHVPGCCVAIAACSGWSVVSLASSEPVGYSPICYCAPRARGKGHAVTSCPVDAHAVGGIAGRIRPGRWRGYR